MKPDLMPLASRGWSTFMLEAVEAMLGRGMSASTIAHETGISQTSIIGHRDYWRANVMLWPGPREVALAWVEAARLCGEDPIEAASQPGPSRARCYVFWALVARYPGIPREALAAMLMVQPHLATHEPGYVRNFGMRYALKTPADKWWNGDFARRVASKISKAPPFGPMPDAVVLRSIRDAEAALKAPSAKALLPASEPPLELPPLPARRPEVEPSTSLTVVDLIEQETDAREARPEISIAHDGGDPRGAPICFDPKDAGPAYQTFRLKASECRWPHGEPRSPTFHYCCAPVIDGSPYCGPHAMRARRSAQ